MKPIVWWKVGFGKHPLTYSSLPCTMNPFLIYDMHIFILPWKQKKVDLLVAKFPLICFIPRQIPILEQQATIINKGSILRSHYVSIFNETKSLFIFIFWSYILDHKIIQIYILLIMHYTSHITHTINVFFKRYPWR